MNIAVDWPALLARLAAREIDVRRVLRVSRMQLWRWRNGVQKPNGDHAASLIALDMGADPHPHVTP